MSRPDQSAVPVIEWSTSGVTVFDPASGKIHRGDTIAAVRSKIEGDHVVVALSRRSSFIRTARLPDAGKSEVKKILALQIGTLFPVSPAETAFDFFMTKNKNGEGRLAVVAAVKSDTLKTVMAEVAEAGLKTRAIVPAALGSALLAAEKGFTEAAIVQETNEGLAIDLIEEGELKAARVTPMPAVGQIHAELARSFAAVKMSPAPVIGAAGYAIADGQVDPRSSLAFIGAGSLAINLEPPDLVARRAEGKTKRIRRVAIWLWIACLLLAAVLWDQRSTEQSAIAKGEARWANILKKKKDEEAMIKTTFSEVRKVGTVLNLGFEPRQRLVDVVALLTKLTPEGLWVTGLTVERGKPATIRGTAVNGEAVTKYLEQLSASPRFRDVKLVFANNGQIEKTSVVQFSLTLHVIGNFSLESEAYKP